VTRFSIAYQGFFTEPFVGVLEELLSEQEHVGAR
jgi:hypothetical protein